MNMNTVSTSNTALINTKKDEKKPPSTTRMMVKYAVAVPSVYELGHLGKTFVEAKKAKKPFMECLSAKYIKNFGVAVDGMKNKGKASILELGIRLAKPFLILATIGAGAGYVMKKITDKHPDNGFVKFINGAASILGI